MLRVESKTGDVLGYLPGSPSAAGTVGELFSAAGTRGAVIAAGTDFTVPYTEVGSTGTQSTIIRWHDDIPADCDILVRVI